MQRLKLLFFTLIFLLTSCFQQKNIEAKGEGEHWKVHIIYEVTDSYLYERGGIEFKGDEKLTNVKYTVITDNNVSRKGEFYPQENQIAELFETTVTNHPPTKNEAISLLNHSYIEITWKTSTGEYQERINLKVSS
ncbi:hypothetical protein J27TS8_31190 [Robertmurraya siralis]|uniref:Lipoprotein n=1 Tax=Robertmurraya siralis TaxID=77777 RepID=A0A920BV13_9BACI|nr:hypothetical protein [Robertmurraya siralis]GIN63126.1 hypothetical protein J27TS8_31190 [Robertmurraya siralis]